MRPSAPRSELLLLFWVLLAFGVSSPTVAVPADEWRGEWGAWSRPAGSNSLRGGSLSIFDCTDAESACRVRVQGESIYVGPEPRIELKISSPSTATAQLAQGDDSTRKDCYLDLTMTAEGNGRSLHARVAGKECGDFFTNHEVHFPDVLPFKTAEPFPWRWTPECFADERASRRAWCLDAELQRQDQALETTAEQIAGLLRLLHLNAPRELAASRESLLAGCEHASDIPACLHAGYGTAQADFERDRQAAQEARDREEQALATPGDPAQAARLLSAIQGVFKQRFTNLTVDGTKFSSENILEIVPVGKDSLYFRTHLEFYNGHLCKLYGIARFTSAGRFVFNDRTPEPPPGDPHCRLQLAVTDQEVQLIDPDSSCQRACGMRGHIDGAAFPRTQRRPIHYMARLRSSREYREVATASPQP